jgi:tetratricopeptide (TPR) repeat protein
MEEAVAQSERGCQQRCMASFAEAIGLADRLAADPAIGHPTLGVLVRSQLAETLRAHGQHEDAEAAAWHALDLAVSQDDLDSAAPPMRLVILSVIDQGAERQALADLVVELDLVLGVLDAYRLHVSPPPEPIAVLMEGMARELARAGEVELAREGFAALADLDAARGAHWRLAEDLGQLGWASLQAGDLRAAAWALDRAEEAGGDSIDLAANRGALAFEEGRITDAIGAIRTSADRAGEQGDPYRQAVLLGRLAGLHRVAGSLDRSVAAHREAAELFTALQRPGDAALDRARGALVLAHDGRLDEALDELAEATAVLADGPRPPEVQDLVRRLDRRRLESGALPKDEAAVLLAQVEQHLFQQERPEELLEVALQHVHQAIAAVDDPAAAVQAITALQEQVGLEHEGWQAAWARGLAASGHDRVAAWQEATLAVEWGVTHPLTELRVPGEPPSRPRAALWQHHRLIEELTDGGQHREALDVAERVRAIGRRSLAPPAAPAPAIEELRLQMRAASFRGGELPPAEVREALAAPLRLLLDQEAAAIDGLPEGRRLLARIEGSGDWRPPEGTIVLACFEVGDQVHIVRVDGEGVTRVAEPDRGWLERQLAAWRAGPKVRARRRRGHASGLAELGHLFGSIAGRLIDADRIVWVPAGPLAQIPLAAVPLPDGRPLADVGEAGLELDEHALLRFDVRCLAGERSPAATALVLGREARTTRATEPPPADGRLQPDEVLDAGRAPAAVLLPPCDFDDAGGLQPWTTTWLLAGTGAVIWPLWEPQPEVADAFVAELQGRIEGGATVAEAFTAAQARVRRRWRDPRDWAAWVLAGPVSR